MNMQKQSTAAELTQLDEAAAARQFLLVTTERQDQVDTMVAVWRNALKHHQQAFFTDTRTNLLMATALQLLDEDGPAEEFRMHARGQRDASVRKREYGDAYQRAAEICLMQRRFKLAARYADEAVLFHTRYTESFYVDRVLHFRSLLHQGYLDVQAPLMQIQSDLTKIGSAKAGADAVWWAYVAAGLAQNKADIAILSERVLTSPVSPSRRQRNFVYWAGIFSWSPFLQSLLFKSQLR